MVLFDFAFCFLLLRACGLAVALWIARSGEVREVKETVKWNNELARTRLLGYRSSFYLRWLKGG